VRRAALLVAAALVTGSCGGAKHERVLGEGARHVPAGTVVFFAARTDAPHWRELARAVLHSVPRAAPVGGEIDVAVLPGGRRVDVTHATDAPSGPTLADDPHYRDMLRNLPRNVLGYAYVRGDLAGERLVALPGQVGTAIANFRIRFRVAKHPVTTASNAYLKWRWGAAWLTKRGIGARIRSAGPPLARSNRIRLVQLLAKPYTPALLDEIPADVQSLVDVVVPQGMFELMRRLPPRLVARFPGVAPIDLAQDLDELVLGETALYTRPGGEITLVSSPPDSAQAERALRVLGPRLPHAFIGGQLVVSTKASGLAEFQRATPRLSSDAAFRRAGIPEQVTGLVYERGKLAAWALPDGSDATFAVRFSG
jgi:hypothetical protein